MATQGIVSVTVNGRVEVKFISGCDGYNAPVLAAALMRLKTVPSLEQAYRMAKEAGFGAESDLYVMNREGALPNVSQLPPIYRRTFDQPRFNPRWEQGTADYVEVVEL